MQWIETNVYQYYCFLCMRICHTTSIRGQARHLYKYYYVCDKKVHLCNFESRQFQFNLSHSPEKHKIHFSISPCVCSHTRLDLFLIIWKLSLAVAPLWFTREHSSKYMIMSKWNEIFVWMFNELSWLRSLLKPCFLGHFTILLLYTFSKFFSIYRINCELNEKSFN